MKTVVIGLGNPILMDDGVGIKVAREIKDRLRGLSLFMDGAARSHRMGTVPGVTVKEAGAGGMRLMDELIGYERALIVDAMVTGTCKPGTLHELSLSDLVCTRNMVCTHDTNLPTALEMGRMLGLSLPSDIRIWGIEAVEVESFGEELTEEVAAAVPEAVDRIMAEIYK
jgi:hydrogenase maturation protease